MNYLIIYADINITTIINIHLSEVINYSDVNFECILHEWNSMKKFTASLIILLTIFTFLIFFSVSVFYLKIFSCFFTRRCCWVQLRTIYNIKMGRNKSYGRNCCVPECATPAERGFNFPNDFERANLWKNNINSPALTRKLSTIQSKTYFVMIKELLQNKWLSQFMNNVLAFVLCNKLYFIDYVSQCGSIWNQMKIYSIKKLFLQSGLNPVECNLHLNVFSIYLNLNMQNLFLYCF